MNLRDLLELKAKRNGEKPLVLFNDSVISYAELDRRVNRMANAFYAGGIRPGNRVAVLLWNSPAFFEVWLGLVKIGAWPGFINPFYKGATLQHLIEALEPKLAIVSSDVLANFKQLGPAADVPTIVQPWEAGGTAEIGSLPTIDGYAKDASTDAPPPVPLGRGSIAGLVHTSGTTGFPKFLLLSHGYYLTFGMLRIRQFGALPQDRFYLTMPLHHSHKHLVTPILMDTSLCLSPKFSVSRFWEEVRRSGSTLILAHDQPLVMLLKADPSPRDRDHPGRAVHPGFRMQRQFHERFGIAVTASLGNTESNALALGTWYRSHTDPHYYDSDSPGLEINHDLYDVGIVDDDDRQLPRGSVGEIVSRQKNPHTMFEGYYRAPEKTLEMFRGGWFHHGDLGTIDERGLLHFRGRKVHSIRHRGEFVPHEAIENAANRHDKVAASALVGVPSELGDEDLKLYVVPKAGAAIAPTELLDFLGEQVAYSMVPRYVEFVDDLPRNPGLEKVNFLELRQRGIGSAWDRERTGYKVKRG